MSLFHCESSELGSDYKTICIEVTLGHVGRESCKLINLHTKDTTSIKGEFIQNYFLLKRLVSNLPYCCLSLGRGYSCPKPLRTHGPRLERMKLTTYVFCCDILETILVCLLDASRKRKTLINNVDNAARTI